MAAERYVISHFPHDDDCSCWMKMHVMQSLEARRQMQRQPLFRPQALSPLFVSCRRSIRFCRSRYGSAVNCLWSGVACHDSILSTFTQLQDNKTRANRRLWQISVWLYKLIEDVQNVDTKLRDLSREVERLADLLRSIERTTKQCHEVSLTLAHLDDHMWQQIDNALADCRDTVGDLDRVSMRISGQYNVDPKSVTKLLRKPSVYFRFTVHGDEVADLTKKIYKSNCSMQTALAVVNVSLTFRTQVSQESLFAELRTLKSLVETSLMVARQPPATSSDTDIFAMRQSRNLESLAKAARKFHIDASTTASTQYSMGGDRQSCASWGWSETGGLTTAQRQRIEQWNNLLTVDEAAEDSVSENALSVAPTDSHTTITIPDAEPLPSAEQQGNTKSGDDEDDDGDDGSDGGLDFSKNFEELAYTSFVAQDYSKAEQFLRKAMEGPGRNASGNKTLKMKLALCCCMQESWDQAASIVNSLSKTKSSANLPTFHILQAISLAHFAAERFDEAFGACKTALKGKEKILGTTALTTTSA